MLLVFKLSVVERWCSRLVESGQFNRENSKRVSHA
jgi:hypothetical protein